MKLFGEQGFRGTSVAAIEASAGLTPGAGGLYHHFDSKEAVLRAGVKRHLGRLAALRDIRRLFGSLGDLRAELTLTARYVLAELDNETELLRIVVSEARRRPKVLSRAAEQLLSLTHDEFASWLRNRSETGLTESQAQVIASLGLGALVSTRLMNTVLGLSTVVLDEEELVSMWVEMMLGVLSRSQELGWEQGVDP